MKIFLIALLIVILILFAWSQIDSRRFVVRHYSVTSPKIREPLKLAFITDLHEQCYGHDNDRVAEAVKKEHPDAVVFGGDMIVSRDAAARVNGWHKNSLSLIRRLASAYPCFYNDGNHEIGLRDHRYAEGDDSAYREFESLVESAGVHMLHNRHEEFRGIVIYGMELDVRYYSKQKSIRLEKDGTAARIGRPDPARFNLLVTHDPQYFDDYAAWGADLCLCGHIHGGLVRIPKVGGVLSPAPALFPKYSGGEYRTGRSTMILSCGMGMHSVRLRINNPAELSVVTLLPESIHRPKR